MGKRFKQSIALKHKIEKVELLSELKSPLCRISTESKLVIHKVSLENFVDFLRVSNNTNSMCVYKFISFTANNKPYSLI